MRMIKCDRCKSINEEDGKERILLFQGGTSYSDKVGEMDMCSECRKKVLEFFSPHPEINNP